MTTISVVQSHQKSVEQVRALVADLATELQARHGLDYKWRTEDLVAFSRSGVSGELKISPVEVEIRLKLGFLAGAFRHRIERELQQSMREKLA